MKSYYLALFFTFLLQSGSGVTFGQDFKTTGLIPFYKDHKWGFCTPEKVVKIPLQYDMVYYKNPYFFASSKTHSGILDRHGRFIDSADFVLGKIGNDSFLILKYASQYHLSDITTAQNALLQTDTSFHLFLLHSNKLSLLADGTTDAWMATPPYTFKKTPTLFFINKNGKTGVYDVLKNKFLIDTEYTHFRLPKGNFIVAYNDAKEMEVRHFNGTLLPKAQVYKDENILDILDNGYYTKRSTAQDPNKFTTYNYKLDLFTPDGKVVISNGKNMQIKSDYGIIVCEEEKSSNDMMFTLYSYNGKLLMKGIKDYTEYFPNLLSIYGKGYEKFLGFYNYKLQKMVWKNTYPDTVSVRVLKEFRIPKIEADTMTYFLNDNGTILLSLGKYNRYYAHVFQRMKSIKIYKSANDNHPYQSRTYTALRSSTEEPFAIYDDYQKVKGIEDFLGNFDSEVFAFKYQNKWGLADYDSVILTPQFDSITFTKGYRNFLLYKKGEARIYLRDARKLLPATGYDEAIGYAHHNYYLGIKYLKGLERGQDYRYYKQLPCQIDFMDEKGRILYTCSRAPEYAVNYALTSRNQIIEYPEDNRYPHFQIYDTEHKTEKIISKRCMGFESYQGMPVLAKFLNEDQQIEIWNINPWQLIKTIKEERNFYKSKPADFYTNTDTIRCIALTEVLEKKNPDYMSFSAHDIEKSSRPYNRTETVVGYINIDGTIYGDIP